MPDNFFINNYKKNKEVSKPSSKEKELPENDKKAEKFVFEKLEQKQETKKQVSFPKKHLAAVFLILCGSEKSKEILKSFSEEELIKITNEIIKIDKITNEEIAEVEKSFGKLSAIKEEIKGGKDFARNLLNSAFGITKGSEYFIKCIEKEGESNLEFLNNLSPEQLKTILSEESDLVISFILGMLEPQKAAKILGLLPRDLAVGVIKKMSEKLEINTDTLNIIIEKLKAKVESIKETDTIKIAGKNKLMEILKYTDSEQTDSLLEGLENENPELASEIKENIFTFNDVVMLSRKDLEKALKHYSDKDLAFVLKGAKDELKNVFYTCMTKRRKELIEDEMNILGTVKKTDVDDKRKDFVNFLKDMDLKGQINLRPDKDIYVK